MGIITGARYIVKVQNRWALYIIQEGKTLASSWLDILTFPPLEIANVLQEIAMTLALSHVGVLPETFKVCPPSIM